MLNLNLVNQIKTRIKSRKAEKSENLKRKSEWAEFLLTNMNLD